MGSFISRFWKKKVTTLEELFKIEENLKKIEEYRKSTERKQKKTVANILIYGAALYVLACVIVLVWYLPESWIIRLGLLIPFILVPGIIYGMKRLISGYFNSKMIRANKEYEILQKKKLEILNNVMETETFNKAKDILSEFAPEILFRKENPLSPASQSMALLVAKSSQPPQLRKRSVDNPPQVTASTLGPYALRAVRGAPQPLFSRERGFTDKLVEYIVGDGPGYRFALICKHCNGHNGMALQEEFPYVAFNCCFCLMLNPARNQRPLAPALSDSTATLVALPVIQENVGDNNEQNRRGSQPNTSLNLPLRTGSDVEEEMEVIQENVGDNNEQNRRGSQPNTSLNLPLRTGSNVEEEMEDKLEDTSSLNQQRDISGDSSEEVNETGLSPAQASVAPLPDSKTDDVLVNQKTPVPETKMKESVVILHRLRPELLNDSGTITKD